MLHPILKSRVVGIVRANYIFSDVLKKLKEDGCMEKISSETHKVLMSTPLKCNQCSFEPKNMPQLKQHLLTHIKQDM